MLSKNNFNERLRKMEPRKERFSIRKFTVGAASVLIGFFFMNSIGGQNVQAADSQSQQYTVNNNKDKLVETEKTNDEADQTAKDAADKKQVTAAPKKQNESAASTAKDSSVKSKKAVTKTVEHAAQTKEQTKKTTAQKQSQKTDDQKAVQNKAEKTKQTSLDQDSAKKTTSVKKSDSKISNQDLQKQLENSKLANPGSMSLDQFKKKYTDMSSKMSEMTQTQKDAVAAEYAADYNKLSKADQLVLANMNTATEQPTQVSDLQSFAAALANKDVHAIQLTNNIEFGDGTNQTAITTKKQLGRLQKGEMAFNNGKLIEANNKFNGIAHTVVIDGQGKYDLNMGNTFISIWKNNYNKTDQGWNITFKDLTINQTNNTYSPIYFSNASEDSQKKSSLTFENVTANVARSLNAYSGQYVPIHFVGDNTVTVANMPKGANALNGYTVDFTKSSDPKSTNTTTFNVDGNINGSGNSTNWANAAIFASSTGEKAVNIAKGATLKIKSKSADIRGISAGHIGITGDQGAEVYVAGNLNEDLANGHGTAIWAGNLTIDGGNVTINTKQDNQADGPEYGWVNGVQNYNGYHFAPIALGVGSQKAMQDSNAALNINNAGQLHVTRGVVSTLTPLIAFGTGGAHNGSTFSMKVDKGSVLDLQDGASTPNKASYVGHDFQGYPWDETGAYLGAKNDIFWPGMIHMFGAGCTANLSFGDVKYVNLQRTGGQRGFLIALEGKNNQASINASGVPLAQWMANNTGAIPDHAWLIDGLTSQNEMGNWDANFVPANGNPKINPSAAERNMLFGQSNGQVTMAPIMAGENSARYNNGNVYGPVNDKQGLMNQRSNYLQNLTDNFNWWTPRRISFGHQLDGNKDILKLAEQYEPKAKQVDTTTGKKISDLNKTPGIKGGIEGFYDKNLHLIPVDDFKNVDWSKSQFGVDWSKTPWANASWMPAKKGTKLTDDQITAAVNKVVNSDADQQAFDRMNLKNEITAYNTFIDNLMHAKTNEDGTLAKADAYTGTDKNKTLNNAETSTIVYTDGSVDFVNIPINVSEPKQADLYTPSYKPLIINKKDSIGSEGINFTDKDGKTVTNPKATYDADLSYEGLKIIVSSTDGQLTVDVSNANVGTYNIPVTVTYSDGSKDEVAAPIIVVDENQQATIGENGAIVVTSKTPAAHETNDKTQVIDAKSAIDKVEGYTIDKKTNKISTEATNVADYTAKWDGTTPSTVVEAGEESKTGKELLGKVAVSGTDVEKFLGKDKTAESSDVKFTAAGAEGNKSLSTPVDVKLGSALTEKQFTQLVDSNIPSDEIASYAWQTAPAKKGDKGVIRITFNDQNNGKNTYLDVTVPANDINLVTDADTYAPQTKDISTDKNVTPDAATAITNKNGDKVVEGIKNLPKNSKFTWADPTKVGNDVKTAGKYNEDIIVTYPDKTSETVSTTVTVNPNIDDAFENVDDKNNVDRLYVVEYDYHNPGQETDKPTKKMFLVNYSVDSYVKENVDVSQYKAYQIRADITDTTTGKKVYVAKPVQTPAFIFKDGSIYELDSNGNPGKKVKDGILSKQDAKDLMAKYAQEVTVPEQSIARDGYQSTYKITEKDGDQVTTIEDTTKADKVPSFTTNYNSKYTIVDIRYTKDQNSEYTPSYKKVDVVQGTTVTSDPSFTDKDGKDTSAPDGTTYTIDNGAPTWATIKDGDQSTGTVTITPGEDVNPGAYNVPVTVTYKDGTKDNTSVPVIVTKKDGSQKVTWGDNGAVVTTVDPSKIKAHETTGTSQEVSPAGVVTAVSYKMGEGGKLDTTATPITIDPSTVSWTNKPDTTVDDGIAAGKKIADNTISVDLTNNQAAKDVLGTKAGKVTTNSFDFTASGAGVKSDAKVDVKLGSKLTDDQFNKLVENNIPTDDIASYEWSTKPSQSDHSGVITITFKDQVNGTPTHLDIKVPANNINLVTDADTYEPKTKDITTAQNGDPQAPTAITNKSTDPVVPDIPNLPENTQITWTDPEQVKTDVKTPGYHDESITVTYPDGSKDTVKTTVGVYAPETKPVTTTYGKTPEPSTVITNEPTDPDIPKDVVPLPKDTKIEWADPDQINEDVKKPGTHTETIKVTYPDDPDHPVTKTVEVTVNPGENDTYQPSWDKISVNAGKEASVPVTWDKTPSDKVTYKLADGTPTWINIDKSGKITYTPSADQPESVVPVTVDVTYSDGSTDTVKTKVAVVDPGTVWSTDTSTMFHGDAADYHKTSGNSGKAMDVNDSGFSYIKHWNGDNQESRWDLQGDTYVNTEWNGGAADTSKNFDKSDIQMSWQTSDSVVPSTDVSKFDNGSKDTLYKVDGKVNPDETSQTGQYPGYSKWRIKFNVKKNSTASSLIGDTDMWTGTYFNFYGATAKKDNYVNVGDTVQDASKYVAEDHISDKTDLKNGTVTSITWAKKPGIDGKFDAKNLNGIIRYNFSDGSYLDLATNFKTGDYIDPSKHVDPKDPLYDQTHKEVTRTIEYKTPEGVDPIKPDVQNVDFTRDGYQKIDANGKAIDGQYIWNAWKPVDGDQFPAVEKVQQVHGYDSYIDGTKGVQVDSASATDQDGVPQDGKTVTVSYKKQADTPVKYDSSRDDMSVTRKINYTVPDGQKAYGPDTQTIHYTRKDAKGNAGYTDSVSGKTTWNAWHVVEGETAEFPAVDEVHQIDNYDSYVDGVKSKSVASATVSTKEVNGEQVPQNGKDVTVTYKAQTENVDPRTPGLTDDQKKQLTTEVTRSIKYDVSGTGHKAIPDKTQTVSYERTGVLNKATGKLEADKFGAWTVAEGSDKDFGSYDVTQIKGYDSLIDGVKGATVAEKDVPTTKDDKGYVTPKNAADVTVTYTRQKNKPVKASDDQPATMTVSRKISYEGVPADKVANLPKSQEVQYTREDEDGNIGYQDPTNDKITYNAWRPVDSNKTSFDSIKTPVITTDDGAEYTATIAGKTVTEVPSVAVTMDKDGTPQNGEDVAVKYVETKTPIKADDKNPAEKTITRKIKVNYPTGVSGKQPQDQVVKFTREDDKGNVGYTITNADGTKTTKMNTWKAEGANTWAEYDAPEEKGYTANPGKIEEVTVTSDMSDKTVTIDYTKDGNKPVKASDDHPATMTVTRQINFEGVPADKADQYKNQTQKVEFTRVDKDGNIGYQDPVTDHITYNKWHVVGDAADTGSFKSVATPVITTDDGAEYTATIDGKPASEVPAVDKITTDTKDSKVTVKYVETKTPIKADDKNPAEKTITRKITVNYPTGVSGKQPQDQVVKFSREDGKGNVGYTITNTDGTKTTKMNTWKAEGTNTWAAYSAPKIAGYTPSITIDGKKSDSVPEITVDPEKTKDSQVTIDYTAGDQSFNIEYVDKDGNQIGELVPETGKTGEAIDSNKIDNDIKTNVPTGWEINGKYTIPGGFTDKMGSVKVPVQHKKTITHGNDGEHNDESDVYRKVTRTIDVTGDMSVTKPHQTDALVFYRDKTVDEALKAAGKSEAEYTTYSAWKSNMTDGSTSFKHVGIPSADGYKRTITGGTIETNDGKDYIAGQSGLDTKGNPIKDFTVTVNYTKGDQSFKIEYVDPANNNKVISDFSENGKTGDTVDQIQVKNDIDSNVPEGWQIVPGTETSIPGSFSSKMKPIEIPVEHKKTIIHGNDGNHNDESDVYREVTRTVSVKNPDGSVKNYPETLHLYRDKTVDEALKAAGKSEAEYTTYSDWKSNMTDGSTSFHQVTIPKANGYIISSPDVTLTDGKDGAKEVPSQSALKKGADGKYTPVANYTIHVNYEPQDGVKQVINFVSQFKDDKDKIISTQTETGKTDENRTFITKGQAGSGQVLLNVPKGWVIDGSYPSGFNFKPDAAPIVIPITHGQEAVNVDKKNADTYRQITQNIYVDGNKTPARNMTLTYQRTGMKDLATGNTSWNDWVGTVAEGTNKPVENFPEFDVTKPGYKAVSTDGKIVSRDGKDYVAAGDKIDPDSLTGLKTVENIHVTHEANAHTATVTYIDKDTGAEIKNPDGSAIVGSHYEISGKTGETVDTNAANNVPTGWVLVPNVKYPDTVTFGSDEAKPINVEVQHGTEHIGVDETNKDTYREVTQNIYEEGDTTPARTITLKYQRDGEKDLVTGKTKWNAWEPSVDKQGNKVENFPEFDVTKPGYKAVSTDGKIVSRDGKDYVAAGEKIDPDKLTKLKTVQNIHVTYDAQDQTLKIEYVDPNGQEVGEGFTEPGKTGDQVDTTKVGKDINTNVPKGWEIVTGPDHKINVQMPDKFGNNMDPVKVPVQHAHEIVNVDKNNADTYRKVTQYIYETLPGGQAQQVHETSVEFERTGKKDLATGDVDWNAWQTADGTSDTYKFGEYDINNVPAGYNTMVDGKQAADNKVDPQTVNVNDFTKTENEITRNITFDPQDGISQEIQFVSKFLGDNNKVVGTQSTTGKTGETRTLITTGEPNSDQVLLNVPEGWKLVGDNPSSFTFTSGAKPIQISVTHATRDIKPGDQGVTEDQKKQLTATAHRTIEYDVSGTKHASIPSFTQDVSYERTGTWDEVDKKFTSFTDWKVKDGSYTEFVAKPVTQIDGFDSYIDGTKGTNVDHKTVDFDEYGNPKDADPVKVTYQAQQAPVNNTTVTYKFHDDTDNKYLDNLTKPVTGKIGESVQTGLQLPTGYELAEGQTLPTTITMPDVDDTRTIHLVHGHQDVDPQKVDPTDPKYKDMFTKVHRDIKITKPDQIKPTTTTQSVDFGRQGVEDLVTGQVKGTGDWKPGKIDGNKFTEGGSAEFAGMPLDKVTKDGKTYEPQIAGKTVTEVPSAEITYDENGQPQNGATVDVTYKTAKVTPTDKDADKYEPSYPTKGLTPGKITTVDPTWKDNKKPAEKVTYEITPGSNVPSWVHVDPNKGTVTYDVPADADSQVVTVSITVHYPDNSQDKTTSIGIIVAGKPEVTNPAGPKDVIKTPDKLPEGTKITWTDPDNEPDPSKKGDQVTSVTVTIPDPNSDPKNPTTITVEVPTKVIYTPDTKVPEPIPTPIPEGKLTINYTDPSGKVVGTTTVNGPEGTTVDPSSTISNNVPSGYKLPDGYKTPTAAVIGSTISVSVAPIEHKKPNKPTTPAHTDHKKPVKKNHKKSNWNENYGVHGESGRHRKGYNENYGTKAQSLAGYGRNGLSNIGAKGLNGQDAASNTNAKTLPQTGEKKSAAGLIGLTLAGLVSLIGLAGNRKRKH